MLGEPVALGMSKVDRARSQPKSLPSTVMLIAAANLSTVGGIAFIVLWLLGSIAWTILSGIANLMANDSDSATPQKHMRLIVTMLVGQVIAAAAGIPGGLAFFSEAQRWPRIELFLALLVIGGGLQLWAFFSFFGSKK